MGSVGVDVSLFSTFRQGRFEKGCIRVPEASDVFGLLAVLGIPADEVGVLVINGRDGTLDQPLTEGDRVTLIPAIGGG